MSKRSQRGDISDVFVVPFAMSDDAALRLSHVPESAVLVTIDGREAFVWREGEETKTWYFAEGSK